MRSTLMLAKPAARAASRNARACAALCVRPKRCNSRSSNDCTPRERRLTPLAHHCAKPALLRDVRDMLRLQRRRRAASKVDRLQARLCRRGRADLYQQRREIAPGAALVVLHDREVAIGADAIAKGQVDVTSEACVAAAPQPVRGRIRDALHHWMKIAPTAPGPAWVPTVGPTLFTIMSVGCTASRMRCATLFARSAAAACSTAQRAVPLLRIFPMVMSTT